MDYFWNERYRSTFLSGIAKKISMNASVLSFFLRFLFDLLRAAFNNFTFTMAFSFINDARLCVNLSKYTLVQGVRVNCKKGSHEPATTSLWSNGYNVSFPVTLIKPVHVTFTSSRIRRYRTCGVCLKCYVKPLESILTTTDRRFPRPIHLQLVRQLFFWFHCIVVCYTLAWIMQNRVATKRLFDRVLSFSDDRSMASTRCEISDYLIVMLSERSMVILSWPNNEK